MWLGTPRKLAAEEIAELGVAWHGRASAGPSDSITTSASLLHGGVHSHDVPGERGTHGASSWDGDLFEPLTGRPSSQLPVHFEHLHEGRVEILHELVSRAPKS